MMVWCCVQSLLSQDTDEPWKLYHGNLPPIYLIKDTGRNYTAIIGAKICFPQCAIQLPKPYQPPHFTLHQKNLSTEMTKIIQSGLFHGFHLLLIALLALRGHSPRCRAGQGRCRLHLHNGPNSRRDYQQRYLHILYASKAITLGREPEPCSMSNTVIAQRFSHLTSLAVCCLVFEHASMFVVSCQALNKLLCIFIFSI